MFAIFATVADQPISDANSECARRPSSAYFWAALIWAGAVGLLIWQLYRQRAFFHDDAFISLRYVAHLAEHGELTWNLGERVEGYTNFLQIIATAVLVKLGLNPIDSVRSINAVAAGTLIVSTVLAARRLAPNDPIAIAVGGFFVMSSAPVALWVFGGLEAVMVAAFITAAITVILPVYLTNDRPMARSLSAGLLVGLAYLTRPDALIVGGTVMLGLCCFAPGTWWRRFGSAGLLGAAASAIVLPHIVWRLSYYGDLLPNTFYAKVTLPLLRRLVIGGHYIAVAMLLLPAVPLGIAGLVWAIRKKRVSPAMGLITATVVGYFLYILWAGGDHMPGARLLVPMVAPGSLLVVASLSLNSDPKWRASFAAAAIFVGLVGAVTFQQWRMDAAAFVGSLVGMYISNAWPPGALVALHTAGSTPFFAPNLKFIDMLGLNDRAIAHRSPVPIRTPWQLVPGHAKGDGAYVLRRAPTYVIAGPAEGSLVTTPWFLSDVELGESQEYRRCYVAETAEIPYTEEVARQGPARPRPLVFTYYRRICQPTGG
jgi:arabinofuranosyltransferase